MPVFFYEKIIILLINVIYPIEIYSILVRIIMTSGYKTTKGNKIWILE